MNIDRGYLSHFQDGTREDPTVIGNDQVIGLQAFHRGDKRRRLKAKRLEYWQIKSACSAFDHSLRYSLPSAARTIRLRYYSNDHELVGGPKRG